MFRHDVDLKLILKIRNPCQILFLGNFRQGLISKRDIPNIMTYVFFEGK